MKFNKLKQTDLNLATHFLHKRLQLQMLFFVEVLPNYVKFIQTEWNQNEYNRIAIITVFSAADSRSLKAPPMSCNTGPKFTSYRGEIVLSSSQSAYCPTTPKIEPCGKNSYLHMSGGHGTDSEWAMPEHRVASASQHTECHKEG